MRNVLGNSIFFMNRTIKKGERNLQKKPILALIKKHIHLYTQRMILKSPEAKSAHTNSKD